MSLRTKGFFCHRLASIRLRNEKSEEMKNEMSSSNVVSLGDSYLKSTSYKTITRITWR